MGQIVIVFKDRSRRLALKAFNSPGYLRYCDIMQLSKCLSHTVFIPLLVLLFFSCKNTPEVNRRDSNRHQEDEVVDFDFDKIQERGYLTAIMDNSSTGMFQYRGQTMGYEYELLKMFADSMGVGLRITIQPNLEEAFALLNKGEGDILAYNLTVTKERKKRIAFSEYHNLVKQVLVQRKPENWRQMKLHEIEKTLIRNPVDLIGQEVHVRYRSAFLSRLQNLSDEIGGDILIVEDFPNVMTEGLLEKVANGEIDFTVAEEDVALVNAAYYPILDTKTAVSFPQQIAWGLRKNADSLQLVINTWIQKMKKTPEYYTVYNRYFRSSRASRIRNRSQYSSMGGGELSPYDSLIREAAVSLGWDWRLLAAQVFKESKFDPKSESWAGAIGLMQVLPRTGESYGVTDLKNPEENLKAGLRHLQWLQKVWTDEIEDEVERNKFILASYNVGHGHVFDAIRLADKHGEIPNSWDIIAKYLLLKEQPEYYNDPDVEFGYCRGSEPVNYVKVIQSTFENYRQLFPDEEVDPSLEDNSES